MHDLFEKSKLLSAFSDTKKCGEIFWLDCIDSTNTHALKLLSEGIQAPFVVVAREQNAGKGRLSRKWYAQPDSTLCMSVAVSMSDDSNLLRSFTVRVANAVCSALEKELSAKLFIKWPNDIYSEQGKKIAGMLTELKIEKNKKTIVLGIGINCFSPKVEVDASIIETMGVLEDVANRDFSMCEIAKIVASAIVDASKETSIENVASNFSKYDWLKGKEIQVDTGSSMLSGLASGIVDCGELLLMLENGDIHQIPALEASIVKK